MEPPPRRQKPEGEGNRIVLALAAEEAAFVEAQCRQLWINRAEYLQALLEANDERTPTASLEAPPSTAPLDRSTTVGRLLAHGWVMTLTPIQQGDVSGWNLQGTRKGGAHQDLHRPPGNRLHRPPG